MTKFMPKGKPASAVVISGSPRTPQTAANCNRPIRWASLEEGGIQTAYVGGVAELAASLACYADTKEDARDLQGAAALLYDVRNRMERRERRLVGAVHA